MGLLDGNINASGLLDMLVSARDTIKIDSDELTRRTRGDFGDKASALGLRAADNIVGGFIDDYDSLFETAATGANDFATGIVTDPIGTVQGIGEYLQDIQRYAATPTPTEQQFSNMEGVQEFIDGGGTYDEVKTQFEQDSYNAALEAASMVMGIGGVAGGIPKGAIGSNSPFSGVNKTADLTDAQLDAQKILDMRAEGKASSVPDSLFATADQKYLYDNYPLPMDQASRMQRAKELGYDVDNPYRHSTPNDFQAFDTQKVDVGTHIGSAEQAENRFNHLFNNSGQNFQTHGLLSKAGNRPSYEMPDVGLWNNASVVYNNFEQRRMGNDANLDDKIFGNVDQSLHADEYIGSGDYVKSPENREMLNQINEQFQDAGYGSIKYLNEAETMYKGKGRMDPEISKRIDANEDEIQSIISGARDRYVSERPKMPDASDPDAEAKLKAYFDYNESNPYDPLKQQTPEETIRIAQLKRENSSLDVPENRQSPYSTIVLDPADLRSTNARFDPEFADSADLLSANRSKTGGLLAAGMGRKDPSKANKRDLDPYGFQKSKLTTGQYLDDTELRYNDYGRLLPREQKSWEDMLGKYTIPFFGDRTRGGGELLGINDIDFEFPVVAEGGTDFMRDLANQRERAIWASKRGRISTINNKVNEAAKRLGTDEIYGVTGSMAPDASDFATFTGEALAELVGKSPITKKFAKEYDRNAKGIIDESFVGLLSPDLRNWAKNADPEARKRFIRSFDTAPNLAAGLPNPALARWGVNALDQRNIESGMFGLGASKIDIGAPQLYNFPKQGTNEYRAAQPHGTYDTQLTGDYFGTLPPIPQEILYSDAINEMLKTLDVNGNIKGKSNLTHGLKTQLPVEQVTQQKLDRIMEYLARKGK